MALDSIYRDLFRKYGHQPEYLQSVRDVLDSISDAYLHQPRYAELGIIERLTEPDRSVIFRIAWTTDSGEVRINTGYRVQFSNAAGPYKGGICFRPDAAFSTIKATAFDQIFRNALTSLPLGGAAGGADFDPAGRSDNEIMRFCQAFMLELWNNIGPTTDILSGGDGVGQREIGYMYGMYKKLSRQHTGTFTGKGLNWGGSHVSDEATGYGAIYFTEQMLKSRSKNIMGKTFALSGFGSIAQAAAQKAIQLGAKIVTISDPDGYVYIPDGISPEGIEYMQELCASQQTSVQSFATRFECEYIAGSRPWEAPCDIALLCAADDKLALADAETLSANGCLCVCEAADTSCKAEAIQLFQDKDILYSPGKASGAGGAIVSGLEMTQNAVRYSWAAKDVDDKLRRIMTDIHSSCVKHGHISDDRIDYVRGANIAGFIKVADAMSDQGII